MPRDQLCSRATNEPALDETSCSCSPRAEQRCWGLDRGPWFPSWWTGHNRHSFRAMVQPITARPADSDSQSLQSPGDGSKVSNGLQYCVIPLFWTQQTYTCTFPIICFCFLISFIYNRFSNANCYRSTPRTASVFSPDEQVMFPDRQIVRNQES